MDSTLSYKKHIHNTKMKVSSRNYPLKKLSNSKWGCNARTIRTTALTPSYSAAEYACPVWARSPHASKLDTELNDACRSIIGCLRPTNVEELYLLAGIAPPDIRRDACARVEKKKQETNAAPLHGQIPAERRLKRECFLSSVQPADFHGKSSAAVNGNTGRTCHNTTVLSTWMKVEQRGIHILVHGQRGDVSHWCSMQQERWKYFNGDTTCECGQAPEPPSICYNARY